MINLSPADIRKEGTHIDLPPAVGILAASARFKGVIIPQGNAAEASVVNGVEMVAVKDLKEAV